MDAAAWFATTCMHAGLLFGVGGVLAQSWITGFSRAATWTSTSSLAVGGVAAVATIFFNAQHEGLPPHLSIGTAWLTRIDAHAEAAAFAAIMLAGVSTILRGLSGRGLSLVALTLAGASLALGGGASSVAPEWLTRPAALIHGTGLVFWVGALPPLWSSLACSGPRGGVALLRFSRSIPYAVLPLAAAGMMLALIRLGRLDTLWTTAYGWILLAKLMLVAAILGIAAFNRLQLTDTAVADDPGARHQLRRSVLFEIGIVMVVLAIVSTWRALPAQL